MEQFDGVLLYNPYPVNMVYSAHRFHSRIRVNMVYKVTKMLAQKPERVLTLST